MARRRICTFCLERPVFKKEENACSPCLREMEAAEVVFRASQTTSRLCRECHSPLPASRFLKCLDCDPPAARETADEWDEFDDTNDASVTWGELFPASPEDIKMCHRCGLAKPYGSFPRQRTTSDGYRGHCKDCDRLVQREARRQTKEVTNVVVDD